MASNAPHFPSTQADPEADTDSVALSNALFDDPEADVVLLSCDSQTFRVLKLYIIRSSTVLGNRIRDAFDSFHAVCRDAEVLPEVQLDVRSAILSNLLTFIFPIPPVLPSTLEETMELLSVAQKYEMSSVLTHIRGSLALRHPPFIRPENAFLAYSVAQMYGLRKEAAQAARLTLKLNLTIESLNDELKAIPGPYLYELWKYHKRVRAELSSDLSAATFSSTLTSLSCPRGTWAHSCVQSIIRNPSLFDPIEFQMALARHVTSKRSFFSVNGCSSCAQIPVETIRTFWAALSAVVHRCMEKAESELSILGTEIVSESQIGTPATPLPLPECLDKGQADIIVRTSDLVNFPVHKSVLASSSPIFRDMFSLPDTPNHVMVDALPVVDISEDAELVRSLITMLYPIPSEIPASYDRVLALLAATKKYEMEAVQSSIRAEVARRPLLNVDAFRAYAIASRIGLTPEMDTAARLTLDHPMTFEHLGDVLLLFGGRALHELASFREQCRDNLVSCFRSFLDIRVDGSPSRIWVGCPGQKAEHVDSAKDGRRKPRHMVSPGANSNGTTGNDDPKASAPTLPSWLHDLFANEIGELTQAFAQPLIKPSSIREKYLGALRSHASPDICTFCVKVHVMKGESYCVRLEQALTLARAKASTTFSLRENY